MAETTYTYSILHDLPESSVNPGKLDQEIRSSAIIIALARIETEADALRIVFRDQLSSTDKTLLDGDTTDPAGGILAAHDSSPYSDPLEVKLSVTEKTSEGWLPTVSRKPFEVPSITAVSINYANKATWWYGSDRITEELVSPDGTGKIYATAAGGQIINIYKLTEGDLQTAYYNPTDHKVRVFKNDVELSGKEHGFEAGSTAANTTGSHADSYVVNYSTGVVTFDNDQSAHTIKVSYSKPNKGNFQLSPPTGKRWRIHHIELQFGTDHTTWTNPMQFVMGMNYSATGGYDYPAKIFTYRGIADILNKANLGTSVPACGELTAPLYQIPFDYISGFNLVPKGTTPDPTKNTLNYLELKMKYDLPIPNTQLATASFYIFEEDL